MSRCKPKRVRIPRTSLVSAKARTVRHLHLRRPRAFSVSGRARLGSYRDYALIVIAHGDRYRRGRREPRCLCRMRGILRDRASLRAAGGMGETTDRWNGGHVWEVRLNFTRAGHRASLPENEHRPTSRLIIHIQNAAGQQKFREERGASPVRTNGRIRVRCLKLALRVGRAAA